MKKVLILILAFGLYGCAENSTNLDSDDFDSKDHRIEILKREIRSFSDFEDAEFKLFNVNGFSNGRLDVPGASSWDYKFGIKVKSTDLDRWTEGMVRVDSIDYNKDWIALIIEKRKSDWSINSQPEYYRRTGFDVMLVLYRAEGIVFKRVIGN